MLSFLEVSASPVDEDHVFLALSTGAGGEVWDKSWDGEG